MDDGTKKSSGALLNRVWLFPVALAAYTMKYAITFGLESLYGCTGAAPGTVYGKLYGYPNSSRWFGDPSTADASPGEPPPTFVGSDSEFGKDELVGGRLAILLTGVVVLCNLKGALGAAPPTE
ncbi:hypothetical protein CYLTODRAFT_460637 [Cylindrobasidium torrendii FP15055 ss-10]|uniref:Uncharacterized protein n=1 Tax=Cylindrobasidium torrendii FP15055 ss-10 TaxID=1314674 RepID=A0A0D7AQU0_9AGAR|nr:hypothetical protein CYLTODRAFT_460637 [Cylindrobasidium torrendii FP15055 ss-10]